MIVLQVTSTSIEWVQQVFSETRKTWFTSKEVTPGLRDILVTLPGGLFTDTAAILNSIVLTEKLWAAEGAIAGKFIVYTAFRINFYCLSLIFHNKYYKRYIFPSRYLAVVPMVIEKLLLKVITPQYSQFSLFLICPLGIP